MANLGQNPRLASTDSVCSSELCRKLFVTLYPPTVTVQIVMHTKCYSNIIHYVIVH